MKKMTVIALLSVILLPLNLWSAPHTAVSAAESAPGYVYTIIDNEATVTGFEGEPVYIDIPETVEGCRVTEIRDNAFYECGTLRHVTLPNTVEKIGHHAFYACFSLESITIPDSVKEIGMGCFCGCGSLSSVRLPDNIARLPESCFRSCTSLKNIEIPQNTAEIGDFCFSGCTSLSAVSLSDSMTTLGDCSFYMCSSLKSIYIPPSVTEFGVCSVGYTPTENGASKIESFTIFGRKKSSAKTYADENAISFENADDAVHAFAIQRINGQRIPIPSTFLLLGGIFVLLVAVLSLRKKIHRK